MRRGLIYLALVLTAFLLQNNVFAVSPLIGATPNLLLILTFTTGFVRGKKEGMLLGFVCGLLMDMAYGEIVGFYALIYLCIGYVNGSISQMFYKEFLNMPLLLCIMSDFLYNLYIYVFGFMIRGKMDLPVYIPDVIIPEIVYTSVLTLILYPLYLRLAEWLDKLEKRSAKRFV